MFLNRIFGARNYLLIYLLIIFLLNLFLIQLPLLSTFGYEFAAINGFVFALISGFYTFNFLSKLEIKISELIKNIFILFVIPLIVVITNSIIYMFCSFWDGLIFYVLIVTTSALLGCSIAFIVDFLSIRFKKVIFLLIIFFIALIPILEIYFLPQVYFYSPLIGFFPGNIYDEGLSPDFKLLLHQLFIILFSGLIILAVRKYKSFFVKRKIILVFIILLITASFQFSAVLFGFTTTYSSLENSLNKEISSDQIVLHFDKLDEIESEYVKLCADYYYAEIEKVLKVKPSKKIHIYIFNNRKQKKELFGAGNADVAKPWQYSIYISADSWEHTLKHELVHIFSAEFGAGPFKLAAGLNPALIEGIAEAIENNVDNYSLFDFTSLAYNHNHRIDLSSLFTGLNFFKSNSSLAYTYSGAFIQFLIEKYEIYKVKDFYSNGDFKSSFNSDLTIEQKQFENKLKDAQFGNQAMADYYFGRLSILQKICPRYVSDRLNDAYNLLQMDNLTEAKKLFVEINNKTLSYASIVGLSEVYLKENKKNEAITLIKNSINKFANTPYSSNLIFRLGDLYALDDQFDSSAFCYNKIVSANPNYHFNYLIGVRLSLLKENNLEIYLTENDSIKLKILTELNDSTYDYNSIPIIIDLLQTQNVNYEESLIVFNKTFIVDNLESSYAAFRLSQYMLANHDFANGRKYAALSLRYKNGNPFYTAMKENFEKANSFFTNIKKNHIDTE